MIEKIKEDMGNHLGEKVRIVFNGGRNRKEEFEATITEMYNFIFVVKINNDINQTKSFTYSDILTETIKIYYK
jgi:uncharacterized protein Veg